MPQQAVSERRSSVSVVCFLWSVAQIWWVTVLGSSRTMLLCRCFIPSNCLSITNSLRLLVTFIFKSVWNCVETSWVVKATLQSQSGQLALFQVVLAVTASDMPKGLSKAENTVKNIFLPVAFSCCLAWYFSRWCLYSQMFILKRTVTCAWVCRCALRRCNKLSFKAWWYLCSCLFLC